MLESRTRAQWGSTMRRKCWTWTTLQPLHFRRASNRLMDWCSMVPCTRMPLWVEVSESMQRDLHWLASQTDLPKQLDAADWLNLQHPSFILLSQTNLFWTCLNALKLGCCIAFLCGKKCLQACTHSNLGGDSFFATDTADMLLMHVERFSPFARLPIQQILPPLHFDTP